MIAFLSYGWLVAEALNPAPADAPGDPFAMLRFLLPWAAILAAVYFMFIRPQKKKEQAQRDRVNSMKENDRVVTIGGIHGVVTNVKRDNEQVTIRVDEANGTKLRMNMSAIARVLTDDDQDGSSTVGNKS